MVYDNTKGTPVFEGIPGFAIHDNGEEGNPGRAEGEFRYGLYTDDGRGNGDYIAGSEDLYWIRRIAHSLDLLKQSHILWNTDGEPC